MSRRTERVASTVHQELAMMIQRDLVDPRLVGMPSITRVKVSEDLSIADVFVTIMGTPGEQAAALNALKHSAGLMRTKLTKQMTLRIAPYLKFHIDEDLKKELALQEMLYKVAQENAELDRKRAEAAAAAAEAAGGAGELTEGASETIKGESAVDAGPSSMPSPGTPGAGVENKNT